jgi:fucose permease
VTTAPTQDAPVLTRPAPADKALAGFLLSGFLLALLGAILPAWGYHRDPPDFIAVGNIFLILAAGIVLSAGVARSVLRKGLRFLLVLACGVACASLIYLAAVPAAASAWWRAPGLLTLGIGAGLLNMGLLHAAHRTFDSDAAGSINKGGIWYGLGCTLATVLVAGSFYIYNVTFILALMALAPAFFGWLYRRSEFPEVQPGSEPSLKQAIRDLRSPAAVLFSLLLFFQFGNEWALAGWLPIFLIRRVGLSPTAAIFTLAMYWLFLMAGRLLAVAILPRVRHGKLLLGSVVSALFGCLILFQSSGNKEFPGFTAASGVFFLGAGYASIYPLVAEAIGRRFPYYHPGFFNGVFSIALLGGLLAPATLGYAAVRWGVGVVIGIPLLGTCMVMLLVLLIWLESKVYGK